MTHDRPSFVQHVVARDEPAAALAQRHRDPLVGDL